MPLKKGRHVLACATLLLFSSCVNHHQHEHHEIPLFRTDWVVLEVLNGPVSVTFWERYTKMFSNAIVQQLTW